MRTQTLCSLLLTAPVIRFHFGLSVAIVFLGCQLENNSRIASEPPSNQSTVQSPEFAAGKPVTNIQAPETSTNRVVSLNAEVDHRSDDSNTPPPKITRSQSLAEMMLFQPTKYPDGFKRLVIEGQQVEFLSEDGTQLDGRFFRGVESRHVVLFCHGNGGNLGYRTTRMDRLCKEHQVAIFLFDYRGYGRSKGKPTVSGVLADGRAALRKAAELANVEPSQVTVMGRSMGGAIAAQLATEFRTKGLIIESSFASFREIAKHHTRGTLHFLVPKDRLNSVEQIQQYRGKVLISHGTADHVVPYPQGQKLFAAANQPKMFLEIKDGGHNDPMPVRYKELLADFFGSNK